MANFEKIVKVTDAAFDCIPIVSSITNAAHAIYKLAHKVDALSPVAPGRKTTIKIYSLSKDNFDCFVGFVPILGNIFKLVEFVLRAIHRFDYKPHSILGLLPDDDLITAVCRNNKEIVHLYLRNNALDDPDRADSVLSQAAYCSSNEVFRQVFNHRDDWSAKSLVKALGGCWFVDDTNALNAADILNFWTAHQRVLGADDIYSATSTIKDFLKRGRTALAERVIGILPEKVSFHYMNEILLEYSCAQYNYRGDVEETGVLTAEQRNALIAKSTSPSLEQLKKYYGSVAYLLSRDKIAANYREPHFDTLNKLLDLAQLQPDEIGDFIVRTIGSDEFVFIESLVAKYEGQLTPQSKMKILKRLLPSRFDSLASYQKRTQLFASWTDKWKNDFSAQAHKLYAELVQRSSRVFTSAKRDDPNAGNLLTLNTQFKQILLKACPGCDQAPLEKAV
jgi:hypothetical protein